MLKRFEILIIEDNPADVRLLQEAFAELSANVILRFAKDGAEGLEILASSTKVGQHPDLILLDLNLPKITGHQVLAQIKSNPFTSSTPVIVLTSSRAESDIQLAYEFRANAYLRKPTTLDGLIAAAGKIKTFWLDTATLPRSRARLPFAL